MKLERAKGTRDFGPREEILRQKVIGKLRKVFELYGFSPIDTPLIERYDVLSAKFGAGEGSDAMNEVFTLTDQGKRKLGLRYELTFPLARYVGMNPQMKMPFKRYQVGKVYRDGPIKLGRYREFLQFDVDIVGCKSISADAEIISIMNMGFQKLGLDVCIEVNSRQLLNDIMDYASIAEDKRKSVLISLDKMKKIGESGVKEELVSKIAEETLDKVILLSSVSGTNAEKIEKLEKILGSTPGISQLKELFSAVSEYGVEVVFNPTMVRGLSYYTGPIFEAYLKDSEITSSVAGGGRWDDMIGSYLGKEEQIPATGVAFGIEPIIDELSRRVESKRETSAQLYVIPIGIDATEYCQSFRNAGVNTDTDLMSRSITKNLQYADKLGIPFAVLIGNDEVKKGKVKLRNMESGEEEYLFVEEAAEKIKLCEEK